MKTNQSIRELQQCLDGNIEQLDANYVQNLISSSLQSKEVFLRNSISKAIARLILKYDGKKILYLDKDLKRSSNIVLLDLVHTLVNHQDIAQKISKDALNLLSIDKEWLSIIIKAFGHSVPAQNISGIIDLIIQYCPLNIENLRSLFQICYLNKYEVQLQKTLNKYLQKPRMEVLERIDLMRWLNNPTYTEQFNALREESLILYADPTIDYQALVLFMKELEEWPSVVAYTYRILKKDQEKEEEVDALWLSAELIWAYLQLEAYDKIPLIYQNYWLGVKRNFPYSTTLFQCTQLMAEEGQVILADLCTKVVIDEEETDSSLLALRAKQLEYSEEWAKADQLWRRVIESVPNNPAYLLFTSSNILEHLHRPRQAQVLGEHLSLISGYEQVGRAIIALSNKGSFNKFLNYVFEYSLHLERGHKIYNLLLQELIPALWNDRSQWSKAVAIGIIGTDGDIVHPAIIDRTDFTLRSIIGRYIEINNILNQAEPTSNDLYQFINLFKLILRFDLSTTHLRALLLLMTEAEKKHGFFKKDEFDEFETPEVKELQASFLWLLAKRAEYEYEQKEAINRDTEILISNMELHNAEQVFKKLNNQ